MRQLLLPALLAATSFPLLSQAQTSAAEAATSHSRRGTGIIRGVIRTNDGRPAAFVSVGIARLGKGANTGEDGSFEIKGVEPGTHLLQVSFVGRKPQQQPVTVEAGQTTTADVALPESAAELNEVVVRGTNTINRPATASKADIAPLDLPQSIGVVTSTVIADQQINRLGDALRNVSGVSLTQQRGGVAETFSARGYSIGVGGAGGSIFKNGLLVNTQGFPDASTLESVEVLKGTAALLYGNVSSGLVINTVTKKPRYNWGGSVEMRVGSYSFYKPIVDVYGPLTKNLAFRVVGTYEDAKSYRDVVTQKRLYVNPSLMYKFGQKTDLLVQYDYLHSNITPDAGVGILNINQDAQLPAVNLRSNFINTVWAYNITDQSSASAVLNHRFSDQWRLSAIAGLQDTRVVGFGAAVPNNAIYGDVLPSPNPNNYRRGDYLRALSATRTSERDYNAQLNLNGRFETGPLAHQLLVGGDALRIVTTTNSFKYQDASGKVGTAYDVINILDRTLRPERTDIPSIIDTAHTTAPSYRFGGYVQDLITITPMLKVLGGVRYSWQKTQQTSIDNYDKQRTRLGAAADKVDAAWSPKGAIIFQPLPVLSFYASYANNFLVNTGTDTYGQNLSPSIVNQYEAGVKSELFGSRIFANATVYRYVNNNFAQIAPYYNGAPNANTNIKELTGETTSDGVDVDFSGSLSQHMYFNAGYAYNYARYTNAGTVAGSPVSGERLTNNPAHTANGSIFYTFDQPGLRGLKVGASAFYTGQRLGGNNNTVPEPEYLADGTANPRYVKPTLANGSPNPAYVAPYSRTISLDGFTTIDLTVGYTYRHFSILAKLSNLTNKLNFLVHDRYSINPIPPRQFLTTVAYRF